MLIMLLPSDINIIDRTYIYIYKEVLNLSSLFFCKNITYIIICYFKLLYSDWFLPIASYFVYKNYSRVEATED